MTAASLAVIGSTIVLASFIPGVFGMAGGMVLLGVLLVYFDVATAMVLFSMLQITANGWRALQWRRYVLWPIFGWYVVGAAISFAGMWMIAFVPDKAMVFLTLGLMPFAIEALPAAARPNIEWRGVPFLTGVATTVIQILAGVGVMFLDKTGKIKTKDGKPGVALDWFNMLYQVLLGQEKGPRFGSFVALYGLNNTIDMIDGALARSA